MGTLKLDTWTTSRESGAQYTSILKVLNGVAGIASAFFLVLETALWWNGYSPVAGVIWMAVFLALNALLSVVPSYSSHDRLYRDLFRTLALNPILSVVLYLNVEGPLSPYWIPFIVTAVVSGPTFFPLRSRKWSTSAQIFNAICFMLVYWHCRHMLKWGYAVKVLSVMALVGILMDAVLAVLRRSFQEQEKQSQVLEALLNNFPGAVYSKSLDGRYVLANRYFCQRFGQVIGKKDEDFLSSAPLELNRSTEEKVLRGGKAVQYEESWPGEQATAHFSTVKFCIQHKGEAVALGAISLDVTEKRHADLELEKSRMMMLASAKLASIGEMAGGIAHEINNPLAIICGKIRQLLSKLDQGALDPVHVRKQLVAIDATSMRISTIVKGLKTFARDGQGDPFEEAFVMRILDDTLSFCRSRFSNHGIGLDVRQPSRDLIIECRPVEIGQVLLNLLNNAFDAVEPLSERWVRLGVADDADHVIFTVTDSGRGIPPELKDKILLPFFTTKPLGKGTGLGLSISLGIVGAHQGTLEIPEVTSDQPNTTFKVTLPKRQPAKRQQNRTA